MSKIFTFYKSRGPVSVILSVVLSVFLLVAIVEAATTISTDISTDGALSVTGASTLTGNVTAAGTLAVTGASTLTGLTSMVQASSTRFSVHDTAYFGGTATSTFDSAGNLTVIGTASSTDAIIGGDDTNGTIAGIVFGTCTYNPGEAITASSTLITSCTGADGVRTADRVFVTPRSLEDQLIFTSASSTAANVIQVSVFNAGGRGDLTPASRSWDWMAIR